MSPKIFDRELSTSCHYNFVWYFECVSTLYCILRPLLERHKGLQKTFCKCDGHHDDDHDHDDESFGQVIEFVCMTELSNSPLQTESLSCHISSLRWCNILWKLFFNIPEIENIDSDTDTFQTFKCPIISGLCLVGTERDGRLIFIAIIIGRS